LTGVPHSAQNFAVAVRLALQLVQCLAMGVPHSAQNFAVALRSALQLVQCLAMGVPQESQNFAPARTWLWHAAHSTVAAGAGAAA